MLVMLTPIQEAEIREFIARNRQSRYPYVMTDAMADMMATIDALRVERDEVQSADYRAYEKIRNTAAKEGTDA